MSTVSKEIAVRCIKGNGHYEDDPQIESIWRYESGFDGTPNFKLCYRDRDVQSMMKSPFCVNPIVLWSKYSGLTAEGESLLKEEAMT